MSLYNYILLLKKYRKLYFFLKRIYQDFLYRTKLDNAIPAYLKHKTIEKYLIANSIFIETGTYYGETVEKFINNSNFFRIYSIEASKYLYNITKNYIKDDKVNLFYGTTEKILPLILKKYMHTNTKFTFFLDAHYSHNETFKGKEHFPLIRELKTINKFVKNRNVILINDYNFLPIKIKKFIKKNFILKIINNMCITKI